jgi:predicted outer membrane protein
MNARILASSAAMVFAVALALPARADTPVTGAGLKPAENPDASFIREAGLDNLEGLELARLALESARAPIVRDFARDLIDAQDASIKGLRLVAARNKLALPSELDEDRARRLAALQALEGDEFDSAFLDATLEEQGKLVGLLERAQGTSSDSTVLHYVREQLPIARERLESAQAIHLR